MDTLQRENLAPHTEPGLSERRLRYFFAAASAGSIRGGADALNVEASVVSRQIHLLEKELAVTLFERRGRGVITTDAAQLVIDHYRACLASQDSLLAQLAQLKGIQKGKILIAAGEGYAKDLIDVAMNDFCREFPNVSVSLELISVVDVLRSVAEDRAHVGIAYGSAVDATFQVVANKSHPVCVLASPDHPLAKLERALSLRDLQNYSIGIMPPQHGLGQLVRLAAFTEGVQITPALTTNSVSALKHYAITGAGVSLLNEIAAPEELADGRLVALRMRNNTLEGAITQLVLRQGRIHLPAVEVLVSRLASMKTFR